MPIEELEGHTRLTTQVLQAAPQGLSLWRQVESKLGVPIRETVTWEPCRVLGRNQVGSHYLILWDSNTKMKWVSR